MVRAPDGTFSCGDDFDGSGNVNPYTTLELQQGDYKVWVGSFAPNVGTTGQLTITSDMDATPEVLSYQDVE